MGIGAAIAGGTALAGIGGALISSNAATSAANTQAAAADQASQNALNQYDETKATLAPFVNAGTSALATLLSTLGLPGGSGQNLLQQNGINSLTFQPTQAQLESTPGYQFDLNQGLQATQNANSATGNGVSGAAMKGAANYAAGLANNTLTTQQGIFQQNLGNVLNPLSNLVGTGENAGATTGQQGVQAVGNANNALVTGANDSAAGTVGSANAISGGLSSLGSTPLNTLLYSQLLNGSGSSAGYDPSVYGYTAGGAGTNALQSLDFLPPSLSGSY
jgi:hypothetical protein